MNYSFCESVWAGSRSRWHIRKLSEKGRMLGGGADTKALCGKTVSWDLLAPFIVGRYPVCEKCEQAYREKCVKDLESYQGDKTNEDKSTSKAMRGQGEHADKAP
jgi:hypothetical protein